ncbi:MAG TPA: Rv3235 family protein [Pseudonocardiaceae bacterium]|nr:Rv3235 family protein [Pseudonocardiaceae bacterium]
MTGSIAEPRPHSPSGPVLRRLADILPQPCPAAAPQPAPVAERVADPTAPVQVDRMLRAAVEILGGRRPARQLAGILRPELLNHLVSLQAIAGPLQPRVRKVLARPQGPDTLEAVALVTLRTGVRALAARFEKHVDAGGSRWRCTALQLGLTAGDVAARRRLR